MTVTLYFDYGCDACRACLVLLKELNVEHESKHVSVVAGETRSEAHMKINPLGGVPVLDDNGFILTESVAILKYLTEKHKAADHWYPSDIGQRARVDQFLAWHHTGSRKQLIGYFFSAAYIPYKNNKPIGIAEFEELKQAMEKSLNFLETYFLKDREFMATNDVSLADLIALCEVRQLRALGYDVTKDRPKLATWISKVQEKLNPNLDEIHTEIDDIGKRIQDGLQKLRQE